MPYARVPVLARAANDYATNEQISTEKLIERAEHERRRGRPDIEWVFCEAVAIRAVVLPNETREEIPVVEAEQGQATVHATGGGLPSSPEDYPLAS